MPNDSNHNYLKVGPITYTDIDAANAEIEQLKQLLMERNAIIRCGDAEIECLRREIHYLHQNIAYLKSKIRSLSDSEGAQRPLRAPKKPVGHPESVYQERLKRENEALNPVPLSFNSTQDEPGFRL